MISIGEATAGLYGAWRLAQGDRGGLDWFDASREGAIRSFSAALIALPFAAMVLALEIGQRPVEASGTQVALVYLMAYALEWAAIPLLVYHLSPMLGCEDRFLRFVSALNWARVLELVAFLPAAVFVAAEFGGLLAVVPWLVLGAILVYHWYVALAALEINGGQAAFLTALNLTIGFAINVWAKYLVDPGAFSQ